MISSRAYRNFRDYLAQFWYETAQCIQLRSYAARVTFYRLVDGWKVSAEDLFSGRDEYLKTIHSLV
jgi:hypothetical protein